MQITIEYEVCGELTGGLIYLADSGALLTRYFPRCASTWVPCTDYEIALGTL